MDYTLKMKLIKKYGLRFFQNLDKGVKDQRLIKYYKKKYNSPMHLVVSVQHKSGELRPVEIDEEISAIKGLNMSRYYYSSWLQVKLKKIYGADYFPPVNNTIRPEKIAKFANNGKKSKTGKETNKHPVTMYRGECVYCQKKFTLNIANHPVNLCACLKCAPNGVGYGPYNGKHGISSAA